MIPQIDRTAHNASNLYKQCLFRLEVKQDCQVNHKERELKTLIDGKRLVLEN